MLCFVYSLGKLLHDYPGENKSELASPLILAVNRQDVDMARFLVQQLGFSVNAADSSGRCALVYAINTNNLRLCQLLLNADFKQQTPVAACEDSSQGKQKAAKRVNLKSLLQMQAAPANAKTHADESDEAGCSEDETGQ